VEQPAGGLVLAIPIRRSGKVRLVATASFPTSSPDLVMKLARLFLRESEQREELERRRVESGAYIAEITRSFEELVFLRRISEFLDLADLSRNRWKLAENVLPVLRGSIEAASLVLFAAQQNDDLCDQLSIEVGQPILWIGDRSVDANICTQLVERFRHAAAENPVVRNHADEMFNDANFPGISRFILAPVSSGGRITGWLLAMNRESEVAANSHHGPHRLSHDEFGTVEAGSVQSVASILATHARNIELFEEKEHLLLDAINSLVYAIEAKDPYTCGHSERVALFARRLAQQLGFDQQSCQRIYLSGLLHDVGKIGLSGGILRKQGQPTEEEYAEVRQHPEQAWTMLHELQHLKPLLPGVLHHHESYDGTGYPDGLSGDDIPLDARIMAVADAYDAMTSDRPYRQGMAQETVEGILREGGGRHWDPAVVEAFLAAMPDMIHIRESYQPRPQRRRNSLRGVATEVNPAVAGLRTEPPARPEDSRLGGDMSEGSAIGIQEIQQVESTL
jgi:HD-GYP domain-containing protein (c-di-GMP phosphodiesterase class II)